MEFIARRETFKRALADMLVFSMKVVGYTLVACLVHWLMARMGFGKLPVPIEYVWGVVTGLVIGLGDTGGRQIIRRYNKESCGCE